MKPSSEWVEYADSFAALDDYTHFLPDLFELLGPIENRKILDLGCSNGVMSRLLASRGGCLTGVDICEHAIGIAEELRRGSGQDIAYHCADATNLSLLGESVFDLVLAVNTLCSFGPDRDVMRDIVREMYRLLVPGGALVAVIPHPAFEHQQKCLTRYRRFPDGYTYFRGGTTNTLKLKIGGGEAEFSNVHWTLEDYSRFLNGLFYISDIREPEPDEAFDRVHPEMFTDSSPYPVYMLFKCIKY